MKETKRSRLVLVSLLLLLGLSAYLRLSGIAWGISSGYDHYLNFQPDEFISIRGMLAIDLPAGKLRAPDGYFEGTFNYYLWAVPEMFRELWSGTRPIVGENVPAGQLQFILLSGRLMSVAFDIVTLIFLFAIIRELTDHPLSALLGALVYGVLPMQVIYSHFMRTYVLANLLCVLVIWLSLKALKHHHWLLFVITGLAAGLAAATRYPAGVALGIPCFFVLLEGSGGHEPWLPRLGNRVRYLLSGPLWLLAGGFMVGFLAGEPMLLFDFRSVVHEISFEMSHYGPPGTRNPFDLMPVWRYISVLIPYATYPLLWVLVYLSTLYVILRPSLWPTVVPLCIFVAFYTYAMATGYMAMFARLVMLLLPVFCIFVGLTLGEILPKLAKRSLLFVLVLAIMFLLIAPSALFDWAYGQAMREHDVREFLRRDMQELIKQSARTTIAVSEGGYYFYTAMPAVFPLASNNVAVQLETSLTGPPDFFVMGFAWPLTENERNGSIQKVESGGAFRFVNAYSHAPAIFGKTLDLSTFPPDMTYPFPEILLFRKAP